MLPFEMDSTLDLILVGKSGNGKSATGNSILRGHEKFKSSYNTSSITKNPQYEVAKYDGRLIQVVDCPGVLDTDVDSTGGVDLVVSAIQNAVLTNPQGYHAFIIVVKFAQRFTEEELHCIEILKEILGKDIIKTHGIIVMCNGDTFAYHAKHDGLTLENFCKEQRGGFKNLLNECNNRIVIFDNITDDEDIKNIQLKGLIELVDNLNTKGNRYTNGYFREAMSLTKSLQDEKRMLIVQNLILQEIRNIKKELSTDETKLKSLSELEISSTKLLEEIKKKEKHKDRISDTIRELKLNVIGTHNFIKLTKSMLLAAKAEESQVTEDTSKRPMREIEQECEKQKRLRADMYQNCDEALANKNSTVFTGNYQGEAARKKESDYTNSFPFNSESVEFERLEKQFNKIRCISDMGFFDYCTKFIKQIRHNLNNLQRRF